jgi:hypothetical protein
MALSNTKKLTCLNTLVGISNIPKTEKLIDTTVLVITGVLTILVGIVLKYTFFT